MILDKKNSLGLWDHEPAKLFPFSKRLYHKTGRLAGYVFVLQKQEIVKARGEPAASFHLMEHRALHGFFGREEREFPSLLPTV